MGLNVPDCLCFSCCEMWAQRLCVSLAKGISLFKSHQPFLNNVNESCQSTPLWSATKVKGSMKTLKCWFRWWWLSFAPLKKKIQLLQVLCSRGSFEGCLRLNRLSEMSEVNMKFRLEKDQKRAILYPHHVGNPSNKPGRTPHCFCARHKLNWDANPDAIFVKYCSCFMFLSL